MGLISRVSSRTYRKTWPSISTEYYQTLTSESERPGPSSPRPGSTSQPRRSPDDRLKGAGLSATEAKQIGICVDERRRNKSAENLQRNVQRLKEYKGKLVILKKGAACDVEQNTERKVMALAAPAAKLETAKITEDMKKGSVYQAFHMARANVKYAGQRAKRRAERLAAEEEKKARKK